MFIQFVLLFYMHSVHACSSPYLVILNSHSNDYDLEHSNNINLHVAEEEELPDLCT